MFFKNAKKTFVNVHPQKAKANFSGCLNNQEVIYEVMMTLIAGNAHPKNVLKELLRSFMNVRSKKEKKTFWVPY